MKTLILNTYDPAGCFNFDNAQAEKFFDYVERKALESGYDSVERVCAISVDDDEESEQFVTKCFQNYKIN